MNANLQRLARMIVDREAHVELKLIQQLHKQRACRRRKQRCTLGLDEHLPLTEDSMQEAARGQLAQEIDEKLQKAFTELESGPVNAVTAAAVFGS